MLTQHNYKEKFCKLIDLEMEVHSTILKERYYCIRVVAEVFSRCVCLIFNVELSQVSTTETSITYWIDKLLLTANRCRQDMVKHTSVIVTCDKNDSESSLYGI